MLLKYGDSNTNLIILKLSDSDDLDQRIIWKIIWIFVKISKMSNFLWVKKKILFRGFLFEKLNCTSFLYLDWWPSEIFNPVLYLNTIFKMLFNNVFPEKKTVGM